MNYVLLYGGAMVAVAALAWVLLGPGPGGDG